MVLRASREDCSASNIFIKRKVVFVSITVPARASHCFSGEEVEYVGPLRPIDDIGTWAFNETSFSVPRLPACRERAAKLIIALAARDRWHERDGCDCATVFALRNSPIGAAERRALCRSKKAHLSSLHLASDLRLLPQIGNATAKPGVTNNSCPEAAATSRMRRPGKKFRLRAPGQ
jgi:hypothetical protein